MHSVIHLGAVSGTSIFFYNNKVKMLFKYFLTVTCNFFVIKLFYLLSGVRSLIYLVIIQNNALDYLISSIV